MTPLELIDKALEISGASGGHLLLLRRYAAGPRIRKDLFQVKAAGGDVRIVYSPLDALALARGGAPRAASRFFRSGF